ncbi:hypothetical protein J8273_2427 [Carpediemonas membranifera]|uniref:Uncharacterized protein n=1 Tax=Carpediemonas membranifera TaxID=201153 RepID=A0A8J6B0Y2_9EUKA|nr:hypothetical protein J8273_2427 [Carpediemonas membranifera]|eukprot:KAG9396075.1 hypothetical protein J8273_2427 [Carpediemonas membranifera]
MGDRQVISGCNDCGQLGLGHENEKTGFVDLPFRVGRPITYDHFNVVLSRRQLLFIRRVPENIAESGLLPGYSKNDKCLTPTPLRFPERVKGFYSNLIWVTEGKTVFYNGGAR